MTSKPIAAVTGATSGIGEATAYWLQARDYVVFAAGRNPHAPDVGSALDEGPQRLAPGFVPTSTRPDHPSGATRLANSVPQRSQCGV